MSTITSSGTLYNDGFEITGTTSRVPMVYPIQLIGTITLTFGENLNFSDTNNYFIVSNNTDDVTIDGTNYTVTINGVTAGYSGLISSTSNNTKVQNIGVLSTNGSKLSQGSGWLGQSSFLGTVTNCYSTGAIGNTGDVNTACGGLIGSLAGSGGTCTISNCYSTGDVLNTGCGGIVGDSSGYKFESGVGYCEVNSCYSTGNITGINSGGIAGANAGISGECKVINCYSIGTINGNDAGGIVGSKAGSKFTFVPGKCDIVNCFSTGVISSTSSGGISGSGAGDGGYCKIDGCFSRGNIGGAYSGGICGLIGGSSIYTGTCIINNCYSTGIISGINNSSDNPPPTRAGGIIGPNDRGGGTITITNCYVSGNITNGLDTGGIVGGSSNATVTNCRYNNGWTDITASSTSDGVTTGLLNPVSGSVWKKINTDIPWKLNSFLVGNTAVYNASNKSLTYTSVFPINTYKGLVTPVVIFMLQGIGFSGAFPVDNSTKSLTYNNFPNPVADNTQMTIELASNNTPYDSLDVLLVSVILVTTTTSTTTIPPTTTTTTTSTTTTTTTVQPNVISVTQAYVDSTTFPVTVSGTGKSVKLMENITTTKSINFVFPAGSSVTFDGQGNTITLSGVAGYGGLISSASNITIVQNVGILTTNNSSLARSAGWIGCISFIGGISNCYSTGSISYDTGGIAGTGAGDKGTCTISNCYSTGSIRSAAGGIVGPFAGPFAGTCTITNCYSTGDISGNSGGIASTGAGERGTCTINNCYSTGAITNSSGGIVGKTPVLSNTSNINITNCYVTGSIDNTSDAIASPGSNLTKNTNNRNTAGWIDTSVPFSNKNDNNVWTNVKTNTPWKLFIFLRRTSYAFNTDYTSITYSSIDFPISPLSGNIELVDSNGTTIGSTVSITAAQKSVTISGLRGITYGGNYYFYIRSINLYINSLNISVTHDYVNSTTFPVTVIGTGTNVLLMENIVTTKNIQFIFPAGSSVTFNGQRNTITLDGVAGYGGLISSGSDSTIVQNVGILTTNNSSLSGDNGWVGSTDFRGGISTCYSTGIISGRFCGGIVGNRAGKNGVCNIYNCYSTGAISGAGFISGCGGIVAGNAGFSGTCNITNCYSTGAISDYSGGIAGLGAGVSGICNINNCYSTGAISDYSGGIVGLWAGINGICNINNCYSTGAISVLSGGIVGGLTFKPNDNDTFNTNVTNCYVTGSVISGSGAIAAPGCILNKDTNNKNTDGWIDTSVPFDNKDDTTVWKNVKTNTPWKLFIFLRRTSYTFNADYTSITYSSIDFPISPLGGNIEMVDSTGKSIGSTVSITAAQKSVTISGLSGIVNGGKYYSYIRSINLYINSFTANLNISVTQAYVNSTTFPVTVIGNGTNVLLMENIVTTKKIQFIFPAGSSVTFNGQGNTITLSGVHLYGGLISSGSDSTVVKNVGVLTANNSLLGQDNGWIASKEFRGGISTCYSTGIISFGASGIVGDYAGYGGRCTISNCYSTGDCIGFSGGIVGYYAGNSGSCTISNCYSTGKINSSGGIAGHGAGQNGTCTIDNCYSTGDIVFDSAGGIVGLTPYERNTTSNINITNCYVTGSGGAIAAPGSILTTNTNNRITDGWSDSTADTVLSNTEFIKVSPYIVTNIPYKLFEFLYTASGILNGTTLTYTNIWPLGTVNTANTYLVNDSGIRVSQGTVTVDTTNKILTLTSVGVTTTLANYSLMVSGKYIDRFQLAANYLVRISIIANYYIVIVDSATYTGFKDAVQAAIAKALKVPPTYITILNLSPGSILVDANIPNELISTLRGIVESGNLNVEFNGTTYPADPNYFVVIDNICFHRDTLILTPNGYRKVQDLQRGDLVKTAQGREVPIKRITSFTGSREKCPLHVMYKDTIAPNVPIQDLYMSGGHAFYNDGKWRHMKCSDLTTKLDVDNIEYYNIVLDNYMENTLIANGLEVESLFEMEGLKMRWRCEEKCCKPVIERSKDI